MTQHKLHVGDFNDPEVMREIHRLAQADEDRGLREAEEYGDTPAPLMARAYVPRDTGNIGVLPE